MKFKCNEKKKSLNLKTFGGSSEEAWPLIAYVSCVETAASKNSGACTIKRKFVAICWWKYENGESENNKLGMVGLKVWF